MEFKYTAISKPNPFFSDVDRGKIERESAKEALEKIVDVYSKQWVGGLYLAKIEKDDKPIVEYIVPEKIEDIPLGEIYKNDGKGLYIILKEEEEK